jgi:hypothetical protein
VSRTQDVDDTLALRTLDSYAFACDTRDPARLAGCFVAGGTLTVRWRNREPTTMTFPGDASSVMEILNGFGRTLHFIGNHGVALVGDTATGVAYCFAHHITGPSDYVMAIRYVDEYRREPGGWQFADRQLEVDWTQRAAVAD